MSSEWKDLPVPSFPGHRDAGTGPTLLPWFQRWLRAPPATSSHADVLQIYADAQGCLPAFWSLGLGRLVGGAVWSAFPVI